MSEERTTGPTTVALAYLHTVYCSSYISLRTGQPAACRMRIGNETCFREVPSGACVGVRLAAHVSTACAAAAPPDWPACAAPAMCVGAATCALRRGASAQSASSAGPRDGRWSALARARGQSARARAQSSARTPTPFAISGAKTRQLVDALCRRSQRFSAASATTPACHRDAAATAPLLCLTPTCSCGRLI